MRRAKTIFREAGVPSAKATRARCGAMVAVVAAMLASIGGCASKTPPPSPACEQDCQDGVALRALRETMKYAFNLIVQNQPVGPQDGGIELPLGGKARVFGVATADPLQGVSNVDLTYVFTNVHNFHKDDAPEQNYDVTIDGTLTQKGIIAVQPSSTTALGIGTLAEDAGAEGSTRVSIVGKIYDPPIDYVASPSDAGADESAGCTVTVTQNGNNVSGYFCGRKAGFSF
jgi:hypothetical protein